MQHRANEGYDAAEIAKEFERDPRTVKAHLGLQVSAEPKEKQGDKEVLPRQLELGGAREELINRLLGYRDTLFQWPAPQPGEVVEILLRLRWGRALPLIWEYLEGNEGPQQRVRIRRRYLSMCRFLMEVVERVLESTGLVLVRDAPLEPSKTPNLLLAGPSLDGPPEEYLGAAMVVVVFRMMESIYDEARKQEFNSAYLKWVKEPQEQSEFQPLFQGSETRPSVVPSTNMAEEGFLHLWWEALLIGKVREATEPAVEELMKRIAEEQQAATSLWLEIAAEYEQIAQGLVSARYEG